MKIIIGREQTTRQLLIVKDGRSIRFGQANSVPMDVSRQHIALTKTGDNTYTLTNLNPENVTYINGVAVERKTVTDKDKIELGESRYLLIWSALQEPKTETVNISSLKYVWDEFDAADTAIKIRQRNDGLLASVPMAFTMLGGIISGISEEIRPYALVFTCGAFSLMVYGLYRRFNNNYMVDQKELNRQFQRDYICPKCHQFLGMKEYDLLVGKNCPCCKAKFTES